MLVHDELLLHRVLLAGRVDEPADDGDAAREALLRALLRFTDSFCVVWFKRLIFESSITLFISASSREIKAEYRTVSHFLQLHFELRFRRAVSSPYLSANDDVRESSVMRKKENKTKPWWRRLPGRARGAPPAGAPSRAGSSASTREWGPQIFISVFSIPFHSFFFIFSLYSSGIRSEYPQQF